MDNYTRTELERRLGASPHIQRNISVYEAVLSRGMKEVAAEFGLHYSRVHQICYKVKCTLERIETHPVYVPPASLPRYTKAPHIQIERLELSTRCTLCLLNTNLLTVAHVLEYGQANLLALPNFGKESLKDIISCFEYVGVGHLWSGCVVGSRTPTSDAVAVRRGFVNFNRLTAVAKLKQLLQGNTMLKPEGPDEPKTMVEAKAKFEALQAECERLRAAIEEVRSTIRALKDA
tara:strand:+ start:52 stop:750 length:699 start_codon:yes stop_codon:yes gene_type:complete